MCASFTIDDILAATGGALVHRGAWDTFCGVNTDSRTCQTGELFIPLTGERHDGHEFIPKALLRGARGVLVENRIFQGTGVGAGSNLPRQSQNGIFPRKSLSSRSGTPSPPWAIWPGPGGPVSGCRWWASPAVAARPPPRR
jgi:hypothetical protein